MDKMPTKMDTKTNVVTTARQMIAGVNKRLGSVAQVTLLGNSVTPAQITGQLQALVTLRSDVDTARATLRAKVAAEQAGTPAPRALMSALVLYVKGAYGTSPDVLADFGIIPKKRVAPTIEGKAAASAKRAATRKARNTMGTVQRKGVKGAVTGIVVTPIVAGAPVVQGPSGTSTVPAVTAAPAAAAPTTPAPAAGSPAAATTQHTA